MTSFSLFQRRKIPKDTREESENAILVLFGLSLLFFMLAEQFPFTKKNLIQEEMIEGATIMSEAISVLRECKRKQDLVLDKENDPNQTSLIGLGDSPLSTSLGNLEAKRTTTNPNFAGLIVFLLRKAGVQRGSMIAIGASGSFPGLIVAMLSAAKAMNVTPLMICSLGASHWGANDPDFHWLRMQKCLLREGLFDTQPIAISLGGGRDTGEGMGSLESSLLVEEIRENKIPFLHESDLRKNVKARMTLYEGIAGKNGISAFINIGGSWANMGEDSEVLKFKPGLIKNSRVRKSQKGGVIVEMAARKIPVIHLLYIRGLIQRYGLSWDPVPLPPPGKGKLYKLALMSQKSFLYLTIVYLLLIVLVLAFRDKISFHKAQKVLCLFLLFVINFIGRGF